MTSPIGKPHRLTIVIFAAAALLAATVMAGPAAAGQDGIVETSTPKAYSKVITALKKAITSNKLVIVKQVPYTQMLSMVGVKAENTVGFEIFHPRFGKVIYSKDKNAMLEVPMRILVRETGGKVLIRYRKPSNSLAGYSGLSGLGQELDQLFSNIVATATK